LVARSGFESVSAESPTTQDHWHQAYGFYVCDSFLPPLVAVVRDRTGIHTHGDAVIHTHPSPNAYPESKATPAGWGDPVGADVVQDRPGIHTHGDGVIHTHPFSNAYTGSKATLGVWGDTVGVDFGDTSWEVSGETYENGHDCNGEPANLAIYEWPADDLQAEPEIHTSGFGDVVLDRDRAAFTFAVVPEG